MRLRLRHPSIMLSRLCRVGRLALALGLMLACASQAHGQAKAKPPPRAKPAPRVSLAKRAEYQDALQASQQHLHDVAALKFERLLKEKDLTRSETSRLSTRLVDALLRARLTEKAKVALTLFDVPDSRYWLGQIFLVERKYKEAEQEFEAYLENETPLSGYARLALGQALVGQGRENTGRKEFKLLLLHSDPVVAERARILSNESEALSDRAAIVLKRLGSARGTHDNEFVKACAWIEAGDGKQAEILLRRIIEALPTPETPHEAALKAVSIVRLAEAYALQKRPAAAERTLLTFLDTTSNETYLAQAFALLVRLEIDDERLLKNLLAWCQKPEPAGRHAAALFHAGQWYIEHGRVEDAIKSLEDFRNQHPGHEREGEALRALMMLHGSLGDDDRVVELATVWRNRFGSGGADTLDFLTGMVLHSRSDFAGAAGLFEKSASSAADVTQAQRAMYNAAISHLLGGNESGFRLSLAQLKAPVAQPVGDADGEVVPRPKVLEDHSGRILLERALHLAAKRDNAAEEALQEFIKEYPSHPRVVEAHLAHAEICLLALPARTKAAGASLDAASQVPNLADEWRERIDYTRVWWHEGAANNAGVIAQGQDFLTHWPDSPRRDEVRMKVAQAHYRTDDYARAMEQFSDLAEEHADSPYAETALFFAGRSALMQRTEDGVEKAITFWEEVVAREGPLKREAQLQQALAKRRQGKEDDALIVIEALLDDTPADRAEERFSLLTERGELLTLLSRKDPKHLDAAMAVFRGIIADPAATRLRRARCGVLLAQCLQQSGKPSEALEACHDVIESFLNPKTSATSSSSTSLANAAPVIFANGGGIDTLPVTPQEHTWFYRAGFMALDLLESKKEWAGAATLADRLAQAGGERASEAATRANRLRLEHFLWEK